MTLFMGGIAASQDSPVKRSVTDFFDFFENLEKREIFKKMWENAYGVRSFSKQATSFSS